MNSILTTSAALFCAGDDELSIPVTWFERAIRLLREYRMSPILFTAGGGDFKLDDCHLLADPGEELIKFEEVIKGRRGELEDALHSGVIYSLHLDTPWADAKWRSQWRANVGVSSTNLFLGVENELAPDPTALLRQAHELSKDMFDVRYGFAYMMPLADLPDCYAVGSGRYTFADFREEMRLRSEGRSRPKTADDLWQDELMGKKRHLTGLFRGAYPASVLSEAHVRAADLLAQPIGRLSKLDESLWLWELPESELPQGEKLLREKKLLVSQAS
jgi:hypothetical protein